MLVPAGIQHQPTSAPIWRPRAPSLAMHNLGVCAHRCPAIAHIASESLTSAPLILWAVRRGHAQFAGTNIGAQTPAHFVLISVALRLPSLVLTHAFHCFVFPPRLVSWGGVGAGGHLLPQPLNLQVSTSIGHTYIHQQLGPLSLSSRQQLGPLSPSTRAHTHQQLGPPLSPSSRATFSHTHTHQQPGLPYSPSSRTTLFVHTHQQSGPHSALTAGPLCFLSTSFTIVSVQHSWLLIYIILPTHRLARDLFLISHFSTNKESSTQFFSSTADWAKAAAHLD